MKIVTLTAFFAMTALLNYPARAQPADTLPVNIGVNVGGVNDYAVESYFVDAMKQSRPWGTPNTPWDQAATVDANGWPMQDAGTVVLCCVAGPKGTSLLPGVYALSFQGQASVSLVAFAGTVSTIQYDTATNTSTASVTLAESGPGTSLILSFINTQRTADAAIGSGVTNVMLIRPQMAPNGHAWWTKAGQVFTTPFLDLMKPFSTLRFMDFAATNNSPNVSWSTRTTPQSASQQSANGAAWEYVIALANETHHDIWINIPDQADDDYITQLAALMQAQLDPSLHIWTEYSNEVWNFDFQQASRNLAAANAIVADNPNSPLAIGCPDQADCQYVWAQRLVGLKAIQIGQAFRSAYGSNAAMIHPVYATQLGQTYYVDQVMTMISASMGPPSNYLYALAQAPYWTGDNSLDKLSSTAELANAETNLLTLSGPEHDFAAWATDYGLKSVTYEGGPGMSGTPSVKAKIAANRSAAMGTQVAQALRGAVQNGVSLYMYYNDAGSYGQYGMWGLTENVFGGHTHKLDAVGQVMADQQETLATGHALPSTIEAAYPDFCSGGGFIASDKSYDYLDTGGSCSYLLNVPADGTYSVKLRIGSYGDAGTASLLIDQANVATVTIPSTGGDLQNWTNTAAKRIALTSGLHVLTVQCGQSAFGIQTVKVATVP